MNGHPRSPTGHRSTSRARLFSTRTCGCLMAPCFLVLAFGLIGQGIAETAEVTKTPSSGRLVIVGGGLSQRNEAVYRSFLETVPEDAPIGVIPLASGLTEEAGRSSMTSIQQYATNPDRVFDTDMTSNKPEFASDENCAKSLEKCGALWFTGGDQSRIVAAMRPDSGDTISYKAVLKVLENGGTVGGSSAGAAMMSNPMIRGGDSASAMLHGAGSGERRGGVSVGKGLGLFPYGVTDQHFLERGRFGRLIVALEATDQRLGFGVRENSALVVDLSSGYMTAVGDQAVTIIDHEGKAGDGGKRENIRVHLLDDGDAYDVRTHEVIPSEAKQPLVNLLAAAESDDDAESDFARIWSRVVIAKMIDSLASHPETPVTGHDGNFSYRMSADEKTRFLSTREKGASGVTAINVRLDIDPLEVSESPRDDPFERRSRGRRSREETAATP